jgi:hypothetical protein
MATNTQLMLENDSLTLENLCDSILQISNNIQSVAVINKRGRAIEKKTRNADVPLPDQKSEIYFMQCSLQLSMARDFDEEFGPINYMVTERENSKFVLIPSFSNIILAKTKKNIRQTPLINKIKEAITNFELFGKELAEREVTKFEPV